ncbi:5017_t:CDS:2, partial [Dentiscutata erythropus]
MSKEKIDLENLDLKRTYTFEEFEWINKQPKKNPIEIDGQPVDLFEFKDNKLVPMPQTPIKFETVVCEIGAQLRNWNVMTGQNGIITFSQGGLILTLGEPFSPIFVVEVANIAKKSDPEYKEVYIYRKGQNQYLHRWKDVDEDEILSEFTLDV